MVLMNEAMREPPRQRRNDQAGGERATNGVNVKEIRLPLHSLDKRHLYGLSAAAPTLFVTGQFFAARQNRRNVVQESKT